MTDLTAFAALPPDDLMAEIERMTRNAKRRVDERALRCELEESAREAAADAYNRAFE